MSQPLLEAVPDAPSGKLYQVDGSKVAEWSQKLAAEGLYDHYHEGQTSPWGDYIHERAQVVFYVDQDLWGFFIPEEHEDDPLLRQLIELFYTHDVDLFVAIAKRNGWIS